MGRFAIGDLIVMPQDQFELMDLVIENKWIVTNQNEKVVFVESAAEMGCVCHTGILKETLK